MWLNVYFDLGLGQLTTVLLHWFFYRFFILEAVWINLYLLGTLAFVIGVFIFTQLYTQLPHALGQDTSRGLNPRVTRINQVAKFRRQVRRKNAGFVRQR